MIELKEERDYIKYLMEISPAGITRVDRNGHVAYANRRAEKILGVGLSETEKWTYDAPEWEITDFEGNPFSTENLTFNIVRKTLRPVFGVQHAIQLPDGKRILLSINGVPVFNADGAFDGMVTNIDDITERKQAEDNLRKSEEKYKILFDNAIASIS